MKFIYGNIPGNPEHHFYLQGWNKHKFSSGWSHIIIGLLLGLAITIVLDFVITVFSIVEGFNFSIINNIYLFILIFPLHELIHVLMLPNPNSAIVGLSLKKMVFYVTTEDVIRKNRFLLISLAPLFFLTVIPLFSLFFIQSSVIAHIALLNMLGSGIDLRTSYYISRQPKGSVFLINGSELYSKVN